MTQIKPWQKIVGLTMFSACTVGIVAPVYGQTNAELMAELRRMQERLQQLEAQVANAEARAAEATAAANAAQTTANEAQASTAAAPQAGTAPVVAGAEPPANVIKSGDTGVRVALSGHVNRGVLFFDDGNDSDIRQVDNDNSSTRLRVIGEADVTDDLTIGSNIEVQFESNSSADIRQKDGGSVGVNHFTERKLEVYFDSDTYGKLWLGQGDTASNGTSEVDLSSTSVIAYSSLADVGGNLLFRDNDTGNLTTMTVSSAFSNFDGLSRDDRLRYDTPSFAGFSLAGSISDDNERDLALRYKLSTDDFRFAAAGAYADRKRHVDQYAGSASLLHVPTGLSATVATGGQSIPHAANPYFVYAKLGYQSNFFEFGKTAFSLDGYYGDDFGVANADSYSYGIQAVQSIDRAGTELYLGARVYDYDVPGADLHKIYTVMGGTRVKF